MPFTLQRDEQDFLIFHGAFSALSLVVLLIPIALDVGPRLALLVLLYNISLVAMIHIRDHVEWLRIWVFVAMVSVLQVLPDWFLSSVLGILVFPNDGFPKIGSVSGYMVGLWVIPLFIIVYASITVERRMIRAYLPHLIAALVALVIFGLSEETMWILPSWHAQNVFMVDHMALYILVPEMILGITTYHLYKQSLSTDWFTKVLYAFWVMITYLGAASLFYLLVEGVLLGAI